MTAISRRAAAVSLAAVIGLGLAACARSADSGAVPESPSAAPSTASLATPSASSPDEHQGTPIRIRIGGQTLDASVWDNPTGRALLDHLPLTLSFKDLNGEEKIGHLDHGLTMDGMPEGDDPQVGDLGYYAPWGNVVLYYGDVGRWNGIARVGRIHGDLRAISAQTGDFTAILEATE